MATPGEVERLQGHFENLGRVYQHESVAVSIERVIRRNDELIRRGRTYTQQLRLAEHFTLANLPDSLLSFVREHNELYKAAMRSAQAALRAIEALDMDMDVVTRVAERVVHARLAYYYHSICGTSPPMSHIRPARDDSMRTELINCTTLLIDHIFVLLRDLDNLLPSIPPPTSGDELENIGPDHDVADFGRELVLQRVLYIDPALLRPQPTTNEKGNKRRHHRVQEKQIDFNDPIHRCCICLDHYAPTTHPPFQIKACGHIVGTPCLASWLNSTAENATRCPHCRAVLCERRARRPKAVSSTPPMSAEDPWDAEEQERLQGRIRRALNLLEDVDRVVCEVGVHENSGDWTDDAVEGLNERLFENGVCFGFVRDAFRGVGWRISRVEWDAISEV